jgi:hypothetical protein
VVTFFVASWVLGRQGKQQSEDENTGGRQLSDKPKEVARQMKRDGMASILKSVTYPYYLTPKSRTSASTAPSAPVNPKSSAGC